MKKLPENLSAKLQVRKQNNALRQLPVVTDLIDFASNDYLGLSQSEAIFNEAHEYLTSRQIVQNGATGSRLLSGNHKLYQETEDFIAQFHQAESALIFNSIQIQEGAPPHVPRTVHPSDLFIAAPSRPCLFKVERPQPYSKCGDSP